MKRLAAVLVDDRMRNIDAWSKYLTRNGVATEITDELRNHANEVRTQSSLAQLTSIVVCDMWIITLHQHLDDQDSLMARVLGRDMKQAQSNMNMASTYLHRWQQELSARRQDEIVERVEKCRTCMDVYVDRHEETLRNAGIDPDQFIESLHTNLTRFTEQVAAESTIRA